MSDKLEKPTAFEKFFGNPITEGGLTLIAAYAGAPWAALLPVLSNSLASGRHSGRVEKALNEINETLLQHEEKIKNLSDAQYKLINETILTILQTAEDEKIKYLKSAIENSISEEKVNIVFATQISRILRDISAKEIYFLANHQGYLRIIFGQKPTNDNELCVERNSENGILVSGLISMGLIVPGSTTIDDIGRYYFSPLVKELLKIIHG